MHLILALIVLGVLVTFHELGHFIAARLMGVYVHEFGIGFGPIILSRKTRETIFTLRLIPIGGFNRFAGDEGPEKEEDQDVPDDKKLSSKSPGRKAFIVFGGPLANILVAGRQKR